LTYQTETASRGVGRIGGLSRVTAVRRIFLLFRETVFEAAVRSVCSNNVTTLTFRLIIWIFAENEKHLPSGSEFYVPKTAFHYIRLDITLAIVSFSFLR
jgi:hypothetical protein